jgi:chitin disaccharide deacetylase
LKRHLSIVTVTLLFASLVAAQTSKTVAEQLGYPANSRLLVIHADDFGMMHTVNSAIEEALEKGWVTSASIMVPCPWFPEVATWVKTHPNADLGIHLTLNADWTPYRWVPVSKGASLVDKDGYLPLLTPEVAQQAKMPDVETELHAQIDKAQAAGIHLSHLDTHMGTLFATPQLFSVYVGLQKSYKLPVLLAKTADDPSFDLNAFFKAAGVDPKTVVIDRVLQIGQAVPQAQWLDTYKKMLAPLPPGTYELIVHLAHNDAEIQGATYDHPDWGAQWRQNDFDVVSNPEFQKFLKDQGFVLVTWKQLTKAIPAQ